ncbi:hypothetical protein BGX26_008321 [Mortierella sp. AD094]|nr:hypothetical protein BGX26_008321 [Mortierella sp. AD094]
MLSALQHPSISNSASDNSPRVEPSSQKKTKINSQGPHREDSEANEMAPVRSYGTHEMDYAIDDAPIHPLASHPSSSSKSQHSQGSPTLSSITSLQPQQRQQLVKLKSEHGYLPAPQQTGTPDIIMTREDTDNVHSDQDRPSSSPVISQGEPSEEEPQQISPSHQEKSRLVVDTSRAISPLSSRPIASPMTSSTPTTAYLTPDSGTTAPSSRRSSLRTMTATLPRSPLQVETIALFKQYKNLIPCAKCSSRNTIQRDGMSDGNLRFKCRPPVSMNITCGKSYSESKIRNMIANVVYGYNLPDSGTPTSANGSSENVLAMAPPPSAKPSRRQSRKNEDSDISAERLLQLQQQRREFGRENSISSELQQSYEEMNINGGHPHPVDDRHSQHERMQGFTSRRSSEQIQYRRASAVGDESMMMDYDESSMPPSNHLRVPGAPSLESGDPRPYRPQPAFGNRPIAPSTSSTSLNSAIREGGQKLHHSHSHPNIGQHRHQQFSEQQEIQHREHRGSIGSHGYPPQQQRHLQRQVLRRESAQCHGNVQVRAETSERRFSHPAALQSSGLSKFLPALNDTHSSSRRSSPGDESQIQIVGKVNTPQIGSLPGPTGQYDDANSPASQYERRMSQPYTNDQRSYNRLPPPHLGSHYYDRRASEAETFSYQHREKHEKLNSSVMRYSANKMPSSPYSPIISHSDGATPTHQNASPLFRAPQPESNGGQRHAYLRHQEPSNSVYYQQPRRDDLDPSDSYAPESLSAEEADDRSFARMRHDYKRVNTGRSLTRTSSHPNLYGASMSSSKDINSVMPRNAIKLTCFPNATAPANLTGKVPSSTDLDTSDAVAVKLAQSSKIIIEITQPRDLQAFKPSRSSSFSAFENVPSPLNQQTQRSLRHTASQPNLLARSSTSVLGRRRSVSPDGLDFGSSKKRRADSISRSARDDDEAGMSSSAAAAEAAAAAVVAAAASAARQQGSANDAVARLADSASPSGRLQIVGLDYSGDRRSETSKEIGLGVQVPSTLGDRGEQERAVDSPVIDALGVAGASSYVPLEEQKELGIDYSLFTRVETAAWRILIPPNVVASFRSEDFGLTLKPKLSCSNLDAEVAKLSLNREEDEDDSEDNAESAADVKSNEGEGGPIVTKSRDEDMAAEDEAIMGYAPASKDAMETEEDELVDE